MGTEYKIRAYNTAGTMVDEFTDMLRLGYHRVVNGVGLMSIILPGTHRVIDLLEHRSMVEVYRRNRAQGLDWTVDYTGLYLDQEREQPDREVFTMQCPGLNWLLTTRHVAWAAGTTDRSRFVNQPVETIAKTLVGYNLAANATVANDRELEGAIANFTVQADAISGPNRHWYCAWANVLDTLQRLATVGAGDFDVVATAPAQYQFRWYDEQLGTDRTATVRFSLAWGNMANPRYRLDRRDEKTAAIVAGQGSGSERDVQIVTGADHSTANHIETFVDAREVEVGDTSSLDDKGTQRLEEHEAREEFSFDVIQIPSSAYGVHYFLGDLVAADWRGITATLKVHAVTVTVDDRNDPIEQIGVEMRTV